MWFFAWRTSSTCKQWRHFCCRLTPSSAELAAFASLLPGGQSTGLGGAPVRSRLRPCPLRPHSFLLAPCDAPVPRRSVREPHGPTKQPAPRLPTEPSAGREWVPRGGGFRGKSCLLPGTRRRGYGCGHAPLNPWAALSSRSDVATLRALWAPGISAPYGCDNARDLQWEVTAARRREDLSEPSSQTSARIQPDVTLFWLFPFFAFLGLEAAEAAAKLSLSPYWASFSDPRWGAVRLVCRRQPRPGPERLPTALAHFGGRNVEKLGGSRVGSWLALKHCCREMGSGVLGGLREAIEMPGRWLPRPKRRADAAELEVPVLRAAVFAIWARGWGRSFVASLDLSRPYRAASVARLSAHQTEESSRGSRPLHSCCALPAFGSASARFSPERRSGHLSCLSCPPHLVVPPPNPRLEAPSPPPRSPPPNYSLSSLLRARSPGPKWIVLARAGHGGGCNSARLQPPGAPWRRRQRPPPKQLRLHLGSLDLLPLPPGPRAGVAPGHPLWAGWRRKKRRKKTWTRTPTLRRTPGWAAATSL